MARRGFLTALAATITAWPRFVHGQDGRKTVRIGLFHVGLDHVPPSLDGLRQGLRQLGYREGENIVLDWRNLPDEEAARSTAREFVHAGVDLIVAFENQTVRAAKGATSRVPIVFLHVTDPVADGYVVSLARPGHNLTGVADSDWDLLPKDLEIFKEFLPHDRRLLVLLDPTDPATPRLLAGAGEAARTLGFRFVEREASTRAALERVFTSVKPGDVQGVFLVSPTLYTKFPSLIIQLAAQRRLPVAMHRREWVVQGALFSYGYDFVAVGRSAAVYVDKILKGAKPATLPVEQPTIFDLAINVKTATELGLAIPQSLLLRADHVIR